MEQKELHRKLVHEKEGLFLYYEKCKYKVKRIYQSDTNLSIEYSVAGQIDPDTNKEVNKILILPILKGEG